MAAGRKVAHHFVSAFYLAGFVDPERAKRLWQYDKVRGGVDPSSPRDAARRTDYHSIPKIDGTIDTSVEDCLARIEDQAAPVLRKLTAREVIDNRERSIVSYFVALMLVRVPAFRDGAAKFKAAMIKTLTQQEALRGGFDSIPVPEGSREAIGKAREALSQGEFEVDVYPHGTLDVLLVADDLAAILHRMTWVVLEARGKTRYVTSDNPVTYTDPAADPKSGRPVGLASRTVRVAFPLSSTAALVAGWVYDGGIHHQRATENVVRGINRQTVAGASRFVFASEKSDSLMRLVMKFKDSRSMWEIS
jgi:hypothetical protein